MEGLPRLFLSSLEPVESPPPTRLWGLARSCISIDLVVGRWGGKNKMNCNFWMNSRSTAICSRSWGPTLSVYYVRFPLSTFGDILYSHAGITHSHKLHAAQHQLAYMSMCSEALYTVCGPAGSFMEWFVCVWECVYTLLGSNTNLQPASML